VGERFHLIGYGNQAHPIYNTLVINNSGVEITTSDGANARAVFGKVSRAILSPVNKSDDTTWGLFYNLSNLSSVAVSIGIK
jgi:hypothetical protein